ncbi:hypothetical protein [Ramlibacter albus]|uniref:Uncharacterized protein n=1 Tax=Ramlibacter albus TaxID=2079448 RepID=A0A923S2F7_9BURK|nr:hypothetical protein [Ramlibacter albus]MBC5764708.1 hypothetical protein [Ramlibacter albus]
MLKRKPPPEPEQVAEQLELLAFRPVLAVHEALDALVDFLHAGEEEGVDFDVRRARLGLVQTFANQYQGAIQEQAVEKLRKEAKRAQIERTRLPSAKAIARPKQEEAVKMEADACRNYANGLLSAIEWTAGKRDAGAVEDVNMRRFETPQESDRRKLDAKRVFDATCARHRHIERLLHLDAKTLAAEGAGSRPDWISPELWNAVIPDAVRDCRPHERSDLVQNVLALLELLPPHAPEREDLEAILIEAQAGLDATASVAAPHDAPSAASGGADDKQASLAEPAPASQEDDTRARCAEYVNALLAPATNGGAPLALEQLVRPNVDHRQLRSDIRAAVSRLDEEALKDLSRALAQAIEELPCDDAVRSDLIAIKAQVDADLEDMLK